MILRVYDTIFLTVVFAGMDDANSIFIPKKDALKDEKRIRYYSGYLSYLQAAIKYVILLLITY
jgi:beta-glucosidase